MGGGGGGGGGGANIFKGEEVWVPETELLSGRTGDGDTWRASESVQY